MWILPRVFFFTLEAAKLAVLPETSQRTLQLPQMIMKPIGAAIILTILRTKLDYKVTSYLLVQVVAVHLSI